ncbi:MAG TPA: quinoprotein relay system zinc metallohydrolase 2, partial [Hyphomicrobiaceae bacterium]|nr:quinoprotein relay system zinc metallohydrolase 2 [Hyphomicrobiaceae bacterium]
MLLGDVSNEAHHSVTGSVTRRAALVGGLCLCCLPLPAGAALPAPVLTEVGPGIYIRTGPYQVATADNADGIANTGFVIGRRSVLVTEAGGSLVDGQWLRAEIKKRTDKPIRHVVISHVHPDHAFGAAAFAEDQPAFIGHPGLQAALQTRGEYYRRRLIEVLGADRAGSVVYPTEAAQDGAEIDLGGRVLRLIVHGKAHTDCDLSLLDAESGLLLPADLVFAGRVPSLDGSLKGWLNEMDRLQGLGITRAVPGHGPPVVELASALADLRRYLTLLRDETRQAIAAGVAIGEAGRTVAQAERGRWALFDDYHGRNVIQAYKELE